MKYRVILADTGEDADWIYYSSSGKRVLAEGRCYGVIVTPDGEVAFWDDSGGWAIEKDQTQYRIVLLPED